MTVRTVLQVRGRLGVPFTLQPLTIRLPAKACDVVQHLLPFRLPIEPSLQRLYLARWDVKGETRSRYTWPILRVQCGYVVLINIYPPRFKFQGRCKSLP